MEKYEFQSRLKFPRIFALSIFDLSAFLCQLFCFKNEQLLLSLKHGIAVKIFIVCQNSSSPKEDSG